MIEGGVADRLLVERSLDFVSSDVLQGSYLSLLDRVRMSQTKAAKKRDHNWYT